MARVHLADSIFQNFFRQHDSTQVLQSLTELNAISRNLNDDLLKCYTLSAFGDYYARIRGFNELSTSYLLQAIQQSKSAGSTVAETVSHYKLGRYYYNFKKYPLAFEYLLRANYMAEGIGHSKALQSGWILFYLAKAYHEIGDFDNAVVYYKACLQYDTENDRFKTILSYNNMASIAKDKQQYAAALQYLALTLSTAQTLKDTVWIGLSKGFIGNILYKQGKYDSAITYLEAGYSSNIQHHEWANATSCVLDLAAIAMLQNNMPQASHYINAANTCLLHSNTVTGRKKLYEVLVPYYQKQGNTAAAFNAAQQLKLATDSVQQQINLQDYKNIELRVETEKHLAQLTHLSLKAKNAALKRNAIIAILFLLVLISLIFYRNQRQKRKADKQLHAKQEALLQSEKLRAEEELRNAHLLLNRYTESIHEKNKLIEAVSAELERLKTSLPIEQTNPEKLVYFDNLLKSTILTNDEWDDFKALFDKVHKGFFFKLKETFTSLTESETRLLSLIKLQLSNREMANMQGVSIDAIKKAKQRLRKKINLQDDTKSLEDYIVSI